MVGTCRPFQRRSFFQSLSRAILSVAVLAAGAAPALAANYALLVGVSDYKNKNIRPLRGPANDVTLLWRHLTEKRGFAPGNVVVLADGLPSGNRFPKSSADPTREAIVKELERLATRARAGDLVLIYFSGHGTQQPIRDGSQDAERSNLDQVMLPLDAGDYDRAAKTVTNGIVDDDFGAFLDRIRDRGADVWVVIDACHAGTMTRGEVVGLAVRGIDPGALGVPPPAPLPASARAGEPENWQFASKSRQGSLTGFFAVDSSREAIERSFEEFDAPMVGSGENRRVGVFTYFLLKALDNARQPSLTYRDLAHQIVREMRQSPLAPGAMPTFDGDGLDRPILFAGKALPPPAWRVELRDGKAEVSAGSLHGLAENAVLKLSTSPGADGAEWARATIVETGPIRSVAAIEKMPAGAAPAALWATVAVPGVSFRLTVAEPPTGELTPAVRTLIDGAREFMRERNLGAIDWVAAGAPADTRLQVADGRIWLLPADGEWITEESRRSNPRLRAYPLTPSLPLAVPNASQRLADTLHRIARARNLVRIAEAASGSEAARRIQVKAERLPAPDAARDPNAECAKAHPRGTGTAEPIESGRPPAVLHCDFIRVTVKNTGPRDVDVNVSYVDATSGITPIGRQCTVSVPAGSELRREFWVTTWSRKSNAPDSVGREHIIVTTVEQKDGIQSDLCFIQNPVRSVDAGQRSAARGGRAGWLVGALAQAALAPSRTRGVEVPQDDDGADAAEASMHLFTLQVTPARLP